MSRKSPFLTDGGLAARRALGANQPSRGLHRPKIEFYLVALILLIATAPFVMSLRFGLLIESASMTLVLLTAVLAVNERPGELFMAILLVAPAISAHWISFFRADVQSRSFALWTAIIFVAFVMAQLLQYILRAKRVTAEILHAAVAAYLTMGLLWSLAYLAVAAADPCAFAFTAPALANQELKGFESLYFSFTTLSTVGYGDIVPVSHVARMLTILESTSGTFFVTVLVARLVSIYSSDGASENVNSNSGKSSASQSNEIVE